MNKKDFIETLRSTMDGKIPNGEIDNNIRYYEEYITSSDLKIERERLEELGDPRLIARTIVESYKRSKAAATGNIYEEMRQKNYDESKDYQKYEQGYQGRDSNYSNDKDIRFGMFSNVPWYKKILFRIILLLVVVFIIVITIFFLFNIGIPLLMVFLVYLMVSRLWKRR